MRSSNPVLSRRGAFGQGGAQPGPAAPHPGAQAHQQPYGAPYQQQYGAPYAATQQAYQPGMTPEQLQQMYQAPPAGPLQTGRMTIDDVVMRTGMTLGVLAIGALVAWLTVPVGSFGVPVVCALVAFVVAMVVSLRRSTNPALILTYAGLEGVFLGAISKAFDAQWNGIAIQAVLGTVSVFAGMLIAYRIGAVRVTPRFYKIGMAIAFGFLGLILLNLVFSLFGADLGLREGPIGIIVGLVGVALGAFFLALDFHEVETGIQYGAPQKDAWLAAFGLTLSLVWIYLEMLRLIAILRGDD
ncbi:Bax inhibitor-1/YccA family protein [Allostreptomyces psammosilenae]|uniref:Putative YccA/Bax inhibitor family protein n=1 Tax=Allostreptomyces psammosilenae TaxID=1892865 RepID=A0A852ZXS0_9ACTN|nr:Bax inhibitor-1/YccA family protein [Allostreptomyces psammosilenae]NYI06040.1 putative YccA/Bax inhibitor family protein [Allostreptomyces psammosilenae]